MAGRSKDTRKKIGIAAAVILLLVVGYSLLAGYRLTAGGALATVNPGKYRIVLEQDTAYGKAVLFEDRVNKSFGGARLVKMWGFLYRYDGATLGNTVPDDWPFKASGYGSGSGDDRFFVIVKTASDSRIYTIAAGNHLGHLHFSEPYSMHLDDVKFRPHLYQWAETTEQYALFVFDEYSEANWTIRGFDKEGNLVADKRFAADPRYVSFQSDGSDTDNVGEGRDRDDAGRVNGGAEGNVDGGHSEGDVEDGAEIGLPADIVLQYKDVAAEPLTEGSPDSGKLLIEELPITVSGRSVTLLFYADAAAEQDIYGYLQDGSGSFELGLATAYRREGISSVETIDVTGDGESELLITGAMGAAYTELNVIRYDEAAGGWLNALKMGTPEWIDLDGDGRDELFAVSAGSLPGYVQHYRWSDNGFQYADFGEQAGSVGGSAAVVQHNGVPAIRMEAQGQTALYRFADGRLEQYRPT